MMDSEPTQTQTPPHDNGLQQGAASNATEHNTDDMESSSDHQLNAGDQGQLDDAVPGELEQQSFLTNLVKKKSKRSQKKQVQAKKPLNAFMLFMKEKRPTVKPAIKRRGNSAVTAHLTSVWQSLSSEEQKKYYEGVEDQRFVHQQLRPDCSASDTYDKRFTKVEMRRLKNRDEGTSSDSESEESPPLKSMRLTPKHRKQTSMKDGTDIQWDMKLRSGKHLNYKE